MSVANRVRIAHLTDLHLRLHLPGSSALPQRLSREVPRLLERATLSLREERPDILVCSGDLLDYPTEALDDPETWALARRDLVLIRQALQAAGCPLVIVPGNHDHPELTCEAFPDARHELTVGGVRVLAFDDREDSAHVPHRSGRERQAFEAALADASSPPQVHVQHYLLWPERNEGYPHTYAEAETMREAIVGSGLVRLVLSGHYHRGSPPDRFGDTWYATAPAFCEAPHPIWIYDLGAETLEWRPATVNGR